MYQNIPTLSRIQRLYYSFNLPSFEKYIYSHQSIASFLACAFMYAYLKRHIIGIIAYGLPVGLDLDIRALPSKQASSLRDSGARRFALSWFLVRFSTYHRGTIRLRPTSFLQVASFQFKVGHAASLSNPQKLQSM